MIGAKSQSSSMSAPASISNCLNRLLSRQSIMKVIHLVETNCRVGLPITYTLIRPPPPSLQRQTASVNSMESDRMIELPSHDNNRRIGSTHRSTAVCYRCPTATYCVLNYTVPATTYLLHQKLGNTSSVRHGSCTNFTAGSHLTTMF